MVYQSSSSSLSEQLSLPPGFRFYPTDEELLVQYLCRKASGHHFPLQIIGDIDLYKFDPWDLPSKAIFGENEWYFFSPRERKYPNGTRPNRVAGSGYWKATGTDKIIAFQGKRVGIKKSLVFYVGKAPKGSKTNWIMHEYRISSESHNKLITNSKLDDWVLCRVYKKSCSSALKPSISSPSSSQHEDSGYLATQVGPVNLDLSRLGSGDFNWATLARLTMPQGQTQCELAHAQILCNGTIQNYNCATQQGVQSEINRNQRRVNDVGFIAQSLNPYEMSYPTRSHDMCLFN